ncbi:MAG: hypothetical protein MR277_08900 [Methanobrevibacter ruminantium]|uniref:hypothetical protein n=1 Tax=Methanobrevibacter ruminantium TaxID=83816 RepID=UPI002D7ED2C3|nr:hypothetical protein [Methanobrevibacter ruminantium]MCI5738107.1 hypothetical protein [Methanobrevibacter ruminantium]
MDNHCFIFLKDEYPDWCEDCEKMEKRIMDGDGIGAITLCGKIGEQISKEICKKENLNELCTEDQYHRNQELNNQGIISNNELKLYNKLRVKRNYGVHDDKKIKNEMADAYHNHENLYKVSTRFYKKYVDSDYDFPKYTQPKSIYSQETIIEQNSNSHNVNTENSNNTVNITNITHNHHYSQKNELKANKTEVHNNKKMGEEDEMDRKTLVLGIIAIVAILVIGLSFLASTDNSSTDLEDTSQVSYSDSVASSDNTVDESVSSSSSEESVSSSGAVYWASEKTDKFHKPSCEWAQKISDWNKIVFHSRQEALDSGRQPCEVCNP